MTSNQQQNNVTASTTATGQAGQAGQPGQMGHAKRAVTPATPAAGWLDLYVGKGLLATPAYKIDTHPATIKLDQNESPKDLPPAIKRRIVEAVVEKSWNRYPPAYADELADRLAARDGVAAGSCLLAPGSNLLVSLLLTVYSKGMRGEAVAKPVNGPKPKLVIARPSFPLYEQHCKAEDIPYEPWLLAEHEGRLEYDAALLPPLTPGSMVVFASPNNPVGNALPKSALAKLLGEHPETLFVADEAYFEFAPEPYTDLLEKHANLILVRTFSKTMGAAGVRIGYVLAAPAHIETLRRLRLPYLLNQFSLVAMDVLLSDPSMLRFVDSTRQEVVRERERVEAALRDVAGKRGFRVLPSSANFLLLRWPSADAALAAYQRLIAASILVRNVGGGPQLAGCLRITVGTPSENDALIAALGKAAN